MNAVKIALLGKQVYVVFRQVLIGGIIRNQIDGVGENIFEGKARKVFPVFGCESILQ